MPLQNTAPSPGNLGGLEGMPPQLGGMAFQAAGPAGGPLPAEAFVPATPGSMNQLVAQLLGGPNGTSPATLASIVNLVTPPGTTSGPGSTPQTSSPLTPVTTPPPTGPTFIPPGQTGQLPPVYDVPTQNRTSGS
ncbi:MAG: hypothetical protein ABS35_16525 [Kaistia sp. SCN 65-12]|nr:MAG: hypothetical protein ABS35_16525 [Kaistia sp. SCN 65-12]